MNSQFLICSNDKIIAREELKLISKTNFFSFYSSSASDSLIKDKTTFYLCGDIIPRNAVFDKYSKHSKLSLINFLYKSFGDSMMSYIKGNFIIIVIEGENIKIYTDHFGICKFFYCLKGSGIYTVSGSIDFISAAGIDIEPDKNMQGIVSLLNRMIPGYTRFKGILQSRPATILEISGKNHLISTYWNSYDLISQNKSLSSEADMVFFSQLLKTNFQNFDRYIGPQQHVITLTGGKDSRTGLAALLSIGRTPLGFTYGNPESKDSIYARQLSSILNLNHKVIDPPCTEKWYQEITDSIINLGDPEVNLHRAHRYHAFKEISKALPGTTAYYGGYMGGEFLMGVYYDNLIFSRYLTDFWNRSIHTGYNDIFKEHFIKPGVVDFDYIEQLFSGLMTFNPELSFKERQFFGLFEIGIPHHTQDIFLSGTEFSSVYPFFLDIDLLEPLFSSRYSFIYNDNKTKNLLRRYKLFYFNIWIQHLLAPEMDKIPFGKRGYYNTTEYLRGSLYWSAIKLLRHFTENVKFPPSSVYSSEFRSFLMSKLKQLESQKTHFIHGLYDVNKAIAKLNAVNGKSSESDLRKYSDIVMMFLQTEHYLKSK